MPKFASIYITCPIKEAKKIASSLVKKKLAACVNILSCRSVYRWKGKVAQGRESVLFVKTKSSLFSAIEKEVRKLCSYSVPCILLLEIKKGHGPYLRWVEGETKKT